MFSLLISASKLRVVIFYQISNIMLMFLRNILLKLVVRVTILMTLEFTKTILRLSSHINVQIHQTPLKFIVNFLLCFCYCFSRFS